ncbi:MAG: phosphate/phosphite/phosphonate ABC transporter substrate-binding protein [Candidatus Riflebacteria bacterium]|nr:phosphate/phosphite/phosphonate ABC transporter substrate-binding protein [Candidatus Riflebacteria bacterium]
MSYPNREVKEVVQLEKQLCKSSGKHGFCFLLIVLAAISICGCTKSTQDIGPKYSLVPKAKSPLNLNFAVHPLHNPTKMSQAYQPLMDYLNEKTSGIALKLEASRDYANFESKYEKSEPEFLLSNPWQTLQAMNSGYHVIAMAGDPKDFKGIFVVRKDSMISKPSDLKGQVVCYPSPTALAACVMPQFFLHNHGINVTKDIKNNYVGSQESSIMNVYYKHAIAGATWPTPWRAFQKEHPEEAKSLSVIWETEELVNNAVMIRNNVSIGIQEEIKELLYGLHQSDRGRAILLRMEISKFLPASNKDYDVIRTYIENFEKLVRKVKE